MQKKAVGELIALERMTVLPLNMKLVWVICIALLGWKTGMLSIPHRIRETKQLDNVRFLLVIQWLVSTRYMCNYLCTGVNLLG